MSTKISKKRFVELLRTIIKREIEEASTTATAGGAYDTPRAFSGKGTKMGVPLDRRDSVASGSGFQKVEEQESVNEAVLTISYQPIFDADKKDKLEKIAKKSGLAIRSRGKQGFTVDGKRANVEKFIKATRGMIEVKESVSEDTKDIAKAKQISRQIEKIESKYRKAMYDLSDRLQADPKNHKLQDDLVKSYTKNVTSFMRDMVKLTKRMK